MSSEVLKGLSEAYNSIYSQEKVDQRLTEKLESLMTYLEEIGYDVTDITTNDLYEFYTSQGVDLMEVTIGQLGKALELAKKGSTVLNPKTLQPLIKPVQNIALRAPADFQKDVKPAQDAVSRAPGLLQNVRRGFSQRRAEIKAQKAAERLARGSQPSPIVQKVQQKVGEKLAGAVDPLVKTALGLGVGGLVDQLGFQGGFRKLGGEGLKFTRQFGPTVDKWAGRTPEQPAPAPAAPIQLPAGYRMVNGKVEKVKEDIDLIKKHLLDEGYASTEKQADVIATNMGENWKQSILGDVE